MSGCHHNYRDYCEESGTKWRKERVVAVLHHHETAVSHQNQDGGGHRGSNLGRQETYATHVRAA